VWQDVVILPHSLRGKFTAKSAVQAS
jgi:hypothetical protein